MAAPNAEVRDYLNEVGRLPVLTPEAQLRHCRRIHTWVNHPDGRQQCPYPIRRLGTRSMDVMVRTNLRLVVSIAKRYQSRGLDLCDLIQEGNFGLIRGLELFDPSRGYAVSTYCYWWIRQAMTRSIHQQSRTIRLPINAQELLFKGQRFSEDTMVRTGTPPTIPELATYLGITITRLETLLHNYDVTHCVTLDRLTPEDGTNLHDILPNTHICPSNSPDAFLRDLADTTSLEQALSDLTEIEATIIRETYLNGRTLTDLGNELSLSRHTVTRHQRTAAAKLRQYYAVP